MNEWKFGTFDWTAGTHDTVYICDKIEYMLLQTGWEAAPWSTPTTRAFIRSDWATSPVWRYLGQGTPMRCGIIIYDQATDSGVAANGVHIRVFVENEYQSGLLSLSLTSQQISITPSLVGTDTYIVICGEDGLYIEAGQTGLNGTVALGYVAVFRAWTEMYGTREAETTLTAQGILLELRGLLPYIVNRNDRFVLDDGLNSNKSSSIKPYATRGVDDIYTGAGEGINKRMTVTPFDNLFLAYTGSGVTYPNNGYLSAFACLWTPRDDRWRISKLTMLPYQMNSVTTYPSAFTGSYVSIASVSNNVGASGVLYLYDPRDLRIFPKVVVLGAAMTPWLLIDDAVSGKKYRVVRVDDGGRDCRLGMEWPAADQEVLIPS
jgi:hypothetical protein